ncbi:MAG: hypothetical protein J0L66_13605 [Cytophagales bacterium]|jgi:hypothetical protein|nr:hypothetical protein [Cytophagales bacterium]
MKSTMKKKIKESLSPMQLLVMQRIDNLNTTFNAFPHGKKKIILAVTGVMIACLSSAMVLNAIYGVPANPLTFDKITLPHDIQMQQTDTTTLTPIGKMKGEIDGDFESFYLAVDKDGQVYLNRDPDYSENRYDKSRGWELVTHEQLAVYEKELHFIPHQRKSLKP